MVAGGAAVVVDGPAGAVACPGGFAEVYLTGLPRLTGVSGENRLVSRTVVAFLGVLVALAGCGVDDLGPAAGGTGSTSTTVPAPAVPAETGDPVVDRLLAYGYSLTEASCGADRLRAGLDPDQLAEIVTAQEVTDVAPEVADVYSVVLTECLDD